MKLILAATIAYTSLASALCHDSISCAVGGNDACDQVCKRQGNPAGGRCLPRDGCPGNNICACYPRKRSTEAIDGDKYVRSLLGPVIRAIDDVSDSSYNLKERSEDNSLEKRSFCCSVDDRFKGFCCEAHCSWIGKNGGQCSDKGVVCATTKRRV